MQGRLNPDEVGALLDDLRRIVRALRESSRAAEKAFNVSGAQLFALKAIAEVPGASLVDIATLTRTHQSTVSVVVKRLIEAKLVSREAATDDARRVKLTVTAKGKALLAKSPFAAQERLLAGIEQLPRKHGLELAESLHRLVVAMKLGDERPVMFFEEEEGASPSPRPKRRSEARSGS